MIGQTLHSGYHITARIGSGAMGAVYRATDSQTGKEVAVKVIARDLAFDPEMLERFRREGEALRQLRHPNIVEFIDAFQHEEQYVIVMEYVPGGSLHELLKAGLLPIDRARAIALELCDALTRAHHLNVIHRDIKPENVLIAEDGTPKLTDFGMARLVRESRQLTGSGARIGTPYYMSPEAWEGKPLDAQADIWSLGVVLFEMLSGQVPFGGDTLVAVMNKVLTAQLPDLKELRSDVPPGMAEIARRMLIRDKAARYQTMREVGADLERGEPAAAMRLTPTPTTLPLAAPPGTVTRPTRSGWQWSVVGMAFGAMAVVAFLLLALKGLFFGDSAPTPAPTAAPQIVTQTSVPVTEVAATTGSISGEVVMSGTSWEGHAIYVDLIPWGEFGPVAFTVLTGPGLYSLSEISPGEYTLSVVVDMDNSGHGPPTSGDVIAGYGGEGAQARITIEAGQELTGIDVTLVGVYMEATLAVVGNVACTPVPGVGAGSISGSVSIPITPVPAGSIYVNLSLPDGSPTNYSAKLEQAGPYKLGDVTDGTYQVLAILDTDGSGPTGASQKDYLGWFGGGVQSIKTVTISGGCDMTGVDIAISGQGLQQTTIPTPTTGPQAGATSAPSTSATSAGIGGTTGTISGLITIGEQCLDGQVHPIYPEALGVNRPPGPPDYSAKLTAAGAYALRNVAPGDYYVSAVMDCDSTGQGPNTSGDIVGQHAGVVTVAAGIEVSGVDVTLSFRTR